MEKPKLTAEQHMEAWKARMGQTCVCRAKKPQGHPFCRACWDRLPFTLREQIVEHLTHYYDERYFEARALLESQQ